MKPSLTPATILIVDDSEANLQLLERVLRSADYDVRAASSGAAALERIQHETPDVALLDVSMPQMSGFELCRRLKAHARLASMPVIFISALGDTATVIKGYQAGGVDYITKPFQPQEVLLRVSTQLEVIRQRREIENLRRMEEEKYEEINQLRSDVLRIVSHDLRNAIASARVSIHMLRKATDEAVVEKLRKRLEQIATHLTASNAQMEDLVINLLDVVRDNDAFVQELADLTIDADTAHNFVDEVRRRKQQPPDQASGRDAGDNL